MVVSSALRPKRFSLRSIPSIIHHLLPRTQLISHRPAAAPSRLTDWHPLHHNHAHHPTTDGPSRPPQHGPPRKTNQPPPAAIPGKTSQPKPRSSGPAYPNGALSSSGVPTPKSLTAAGTTSSAASGACATPSPTTPTRPPSRKGWTCVFVDDPALEGASVAELQQRFQAWARAVRSDVDMDGAEVMSRGARHEFFLKVDGEGLWGGYV